MITVVHLVVKKVFLIVSTKSTDSRQIRPTQQGAWPPLHLQAFELLIPAIHPLECVSIAITALTIRQWAEKLPNRDICTFIDAGVGERASGLSSMSSQQAHVCMSTQLGCSPLAKAYSSLSLREIRGFSFWGATSPQPNERKLTAGSSGVGMEGGRGTMESKSVDRKNVSYMTNNMLALLVPPTCDMT